MIAQLKGRMIEVHPSYVIIDCGGVGYHVNISLNTFSKIQQEENILLYTYHLVREEAQTLFGFADKEERKVFELLISVNGVGPSSGMMMLSTLNTGEVYQAISSEDAKQLQSVKGIGAKTAQRIIIDLKDKLEKLADVEILTPGSENKVKFEALSALEVLGISKKKAEPFIQKLVAETPSITLEEVIKETLKKV